MPCATAASRSTPPCGANLPAWQRRRSATRSPSGSCGDGGIPPQMETNMSAASAPARPPMDPATGVRRVKRAPHEMSDPVTATDDLFVLAHLGIPRVDAAAWSLAIDGLVGRQCKFSLAALKALPKKIVEAVHQCCGSPMEPRVPTR